MGLTRMKGAQCGNLRIFLPVRFYVKSILVILEAHKLQFGQFLKPLILDFFKFKHF